MVVSLLLTCSEPPVLQSDVVLAPPPPPSPRLAYMLLLGILSWLLVAGCFLQPAVVPTQHAALLLLACFEPAVLLTALVPIAVSLIMICRAAGCFLQHVDVAAADVLLACCASAELRNGKRPEKTDSHECMFSASAPILMRLYQ